SLRHQGKRVDLGGRRRPLLPPRRLADRQDQGAGSGGQRVLRRPEADPPLRLRHDLALCDLRERARRTLALVTAQSPRATRCALLVPREPVKAALASARAGCGWCRRIRPTGYDPRPAPSSVALRAIPSPAAREKTCPVLSW